MSLPQREWLTVEEVAAYLRVDRSTVYRWIHRKQRPLPNKKMIGCIRVPRERFLAWVEEMA